MKIQNYRPLKILVLAQVPPPFHGQAIMNKYFLDGEYERMRLIPIRMAFSREIGEVGKAGIGKVVHLMGILIRILLARIWHKPDVLYYPPASPNLAPFLRDCVLLITTRWMFPRVVFHFHANGISEYYAKLPLALRWLYRLAYSRPDLSICLSQLAASDARHFQSKHITIVPNGIPDQSETTSRNRPAASTPTLLFLATVSREKGVGTLLDALACLAQSGLPFHCMFAGPFVSDAEEAVLKAQCSMLQLDHYITWRGLVSGEDKWACYQDADIFCFPTFYSAEGFPVVLLEAMMAGLPVVATDWRAIPEIVVEGETGLLVPVRDPAATADRLARLLQDPAMRQRMGQAGRRRFLEKYTIETFRKNMEEAICEL